MQTRLRYGLGIGGAIAVMGLAAFLLFSNDEAPLPTTTAPPPPTTLVTTTAPLPTITLPALSFTFDGSLPEVEPLVEALFRFAHHAGEAPPMPDGLVAWLAGAAPPSSLRVEASTFSAQLKYGQRVAVVTADEDVVLLSDENDGEGWSIVGAKLTRFGKGAWYGGERRTVLLVGSDARWREDPLHARADSLHVLSALPAAGEAAIVGIPRDSWVRGPSGGNHKITDLLALSGVDGLTATVARISGAPIEGYILTGFLGFEILSRNFGPFEIDLPTAVRGGTGFPNFPAGPQVVEPPEKLLLLARIRKTLPNGDLDRSRNHGVIVKGAMASVQSRGISRLPELLAVLFDATWTDLTVGDLLNLGAAAYEIAPEEVANEVVPGRVGSAGGGSVVFLGDGAAAMFADLADDGTISAAG